MELEPTGDEEIGPDDAEMDRERRMEEADARGDFDAEEEKIDPEAEEERKYSEALQRIGLKLSKEDGYKGEYIEKIIKKLMSGQSVKPTTIDIRHSPFYKVIEHFRENLNIYNAMKYLLERGKINEDEYTLALIMTPSEAEQHRIDTINKIKTLDSINSY